ncbi:MAG TPA: hypothetical protein VNG51_27520 [Ktedonobacteraceae bacterium]|nr:hypothetical protein [Ktedonobacteraceae bacterium]
MNPRKPTEEEKAELLECIIKEKYINPPSEEERADEAGMVDNAAIAVFDKYITDGPGYAGKVMVVVWSGSPTFTETYTWERPFLEGEEKIPVGQINWHDGKHEPRLKREYIEQAEPE